MQPSILSFAFRIRPERADADDEEKQRLVQVLHRWLDRYCSRHGLTWGPMQAFPVGQVEHPSDAMMLMALVFELPEDWMCFGSAFTDMIRPPSPAFQMVNLSEMFGFPSDEPEMDEASMDVGGKRVPIGGTPKTQN
jgi:hypothetical protein